MWPRQEAGGCRQNNEQPIRISAIGALEIKHKIETYSAHVDTSQNWSVMCNTYLTRCRSS